MDEFPLPRPTVVLESSKHMTEYSWLARNLSVFSQTHDWRIDPVSNKCADFDSMGL